VRSKGTSPRASTTRTYTCPNVLSRFLPAAREAKGRASHVHQGSAEAARAAAFASSAALPCAPASPAAATLEPGAAGPVVPEKAARGGACAAAGAIEPLAAAMG